MTIVDKLLMKWRILKAAPFIPDGSIVLDVGTGQGELLSMISHKINFGVGIDPDANDKAVSNKIKHIKGSFPEDAEKIDRKFDVITMLAVLEHFDQQHLSECALACHKMLDNEGIVVITIPEPQVDRILSLLSWLRLVKGMCLDQHYGMEPDQAFEIFIKNNFEIVHHEKFQMGLNNLVIMRKK